MKVLFTYQLFGGEQKGNRVLTRTHAERRNNRSMGIDMLRMHVVNKSKNGSGHVLALLYLNIVPPKTDMEPKELGVEDDVATVAK